MKKTLLFLLKTGLFVFFIYNLGILSYLSNMEKATPPPFKTDHGKADIDWLNKKYECALKLGAQYGPEQYFADLAEIELKKNENDFDYRVSTNLQGFISNLGTLFYDNLYLVRMTYPENERNDYLNRIKKAQDKYEKIVDPGATARRKAQKEKINAKGYWPNVFLTFSSWLLKQYLKNGLIAFILLWTWWYKERKTIKITNPLSFLVCLIFYPIIIVRAWLIRLNTETRYLIMTIEYRRRNQNLFALFSKNEIDELKKVARGRISLSDYRLSLKERGLSLNHAWTPALIISIVFILISLPEKSLANLGEKTPLKIVQPSQNAPPNDSITTSGNFFEFVSIINETYTNKIFFKKIILKHHYIKKILTGYKQRLKPIPIFIIN